MWWLLVLLPAAAALNYRCQNNQVLVVQSFGNDTIRMHCQQLDMCGYQQLRCDYDDSQPQCGGLMNFVAHVVQATATSPVEHTCCNLYNPREPHTIPTHVGNDCFIYELPDGSTHPKQPSSHDDTPYTVLKSASEIPEHIDGMSGYRLRLYLLKNKAPPTLLVKGIERRLDGYRVTICRPRCTSYEAVKTEGTQEPPTEWKAISWSSWTSSTWSSWARSVWGNVANGQNRQRVEEIHHTTESKSNPTPDGPNGPQHLHVHVNASGNNNNVIEPAQPGHINITVHTGQYRGGNNEFNTKSEGSRNFENANVGPGTGGGTDNGGKGGGGRHREGDGDGGDAGDADNTKPSRKQNRHEKVGGGDGEGGNGDSGEGGGRGGSRGKNGNGGKNRTGGGDGNGDDADSGAEEGRNGRGDGAGDNLGKDGAKGKGSGKEKGGKGGNGGRGKGDGTENGGDGDDDGSGNGKAGNGGDGADGDGSKASRSKQGGKDTGKGDSDLGGQGGKGEGKGGDGSGDNDGKSGTGDGVGKGGPGGKLDRSGGDGKPGDGDDGGDGGKAGGTDGGSGGSGGDGADKDKKKGTGDGGDGGDGKGGVGGKAGGSGGKHGGSGGTGEDGANGSLGGIDGKNGGDRGGAGDKQGGAGGKGGKARGDDKDGEGGKAGGADGGAKGAAIDGKDGASGEDGAHGGKIRHGPKDGKDGADGGKTGKSGGGKGGRGGDGTDGNDGLSDGDNDNDGKDGQKGHGRIQGRQEVTEETPAAGSATTKRTIDNSKSGSAVNGSDGRGTTPDGGASTSNGGEVKWTDEAGEKAGTDVFTTDEFFVSPGSGGSKTTARPVSGGGGGGLKGGAAGGARQSLSASGPLAGKSGAKDTDAGKSAASNAAGGSAAKAALARAAVNQGASQTPSPTTTLKATTTARTTTRAPSTTARIRGAANLAVAPPSGGGGSGSADAAAGGGGGGSADPPPADPPAFVQANPLAAMNAAVKKMNCFPADAVVTTVTGQKRMDQVAVGDFVLVPSAGDVLKYERVEMFYHREPETRAQFVVLFTASKKRLALTPLHLLPFGECQSMKRDLEKADGVDKWLRASQFAHKAAVGDCVMTVSDSGEVVVDRIVKVGRQVSEGIYSPMTVDGALIVNGVLSSCFSQVESHTVQKIVYDFLTYAYEFFGMSYGRNSVRQGIPSFINYVHELSHVFLPFSKF